MNFAIIIPTLNAEYYFRDFLPALEAQTIKPKRLIVIDSSSNDDTVALAKQAGAEIISIARSEFNHGRTRMIGVDYIASDCEIAVFLTQDAILSEPEAIENLVRAFENPKIGVAYGRQIPREEAGAIETFARIFNYPEISENRSKADIARIGFKACFCSNSFAAYRVNCLLEVGGFPDDTIFGEDALAVAEILFAGGTIRYESTAVVRHSHEYSLVEEFKRYFDVGAMHARSSSLIERFGKPSSAGQAFVVNELKYLARKSPFLIPEAIIRTGLKFTAYKLGLNEMHIPLALKRNISMHRRYWGK